MHDTAERLRRAKQAARQLTQRREQRALRRLGALCAVLGLMLTGALAYVTGGTPGAVQGAYGATLLTDQAGGYVLVGVVSFAAAAAVVLTVVCMRLHAREKQNEGQQQKEPKPPAADR